MQRNLALSLGLAAATLILPQVAMAAPVSSVADGLRTATTSDAGLLQTVHDRGDWGRGRWRGDGWRGGRFNRCGIVRHNCVERFGWGWHAKQCMWRRGC